MKHGADMKSSKIKAKLSLPAILALSCFFIMLFIMGLVKIYSPDLGFHLKSAKWMIENRQFIYTDSFSYGSGGNRYFDFQWLYQLMIYAVKLAGGDKLLVIWNALLITFALYLAWFRYRSFRSTGDTAVKMLFFAIVAVLFVQPLTFEIRPHVLSWIFMNLLLMLLEANKSGNSRYIYLLPLIMLLWSNSHSLAILGLVTIAIYNTGSFLESGKADRKLLLYSVLSVAAFMVTPYFVNGLFYPFTQFGIISGNSLSKSYIGELQSPFSSKEIVLLGTGYFTNPLFIIHLAAVCSVLSIIRSLFQKLFTDALLLAAYLVLLYMANKNYGYFLMVSLPVMVQQFSKWVLWRKNHGMVTQKAGAGSKVKKPLPVLQPATATIINQKLVRRISLTVIVVSVLISITSITDGYAIFRHSPYRFGFDTDKDQLPVDATAFLNNHQVKGKLMNHLDFGGYLMANYNEKVFIDGRLEPIPDSVFRKYDESLTVRFGLKKLLDEYNPDILVFPYVKAAYWWDYLVAKKKQSGYKPVYFDGLSVIYLKSVVFPGIPELEQRNLATVDGAADAGRISACIETDKPGITMALLNGLWTKQVFSIADQNKAAFCFGNRFDTAALGYSVKGIESSTVRTPNIFKNLSVYFKEKKMYELAQLCEDKSE